MQASKKILTAFFLLLAALMLLYSKESLYFALTGLNLWFLKMIPSLLPFMILSGIMVRMNLTEGFAGLFYPVLGRLFSIGKNGVYCIIMGFLCGFPMGARVITELYERGRLTKAEAQYLLSFCNNIGPIYFVSFVLPTIGVESGVFLCLLGMYGLPLVYGLLLRRTVYRGMVQRKQPTSRIPEEETATSASAVSFRQNQGQSLLYCVDDAIQTAINSITGLGGYMILFNLLNLMPHVLFQKLQISERVGSLVLPLLNGLLEITSGISRIGNSFPVAVLVLLPFGGFSCIAQTYSIIKHTDLSLGSYIRHKAGLTLLTTIYYGILTMAGFT